MPHRINKTKSSPSIPIHIIISLIFWYGGKRENLKCYHKGSVVVTYCCITNYPKFSGLKQQTFIISLSLDLEFSCSVAGWLCLSVSHKAPIKVAAGTAVSSKAQHELTRELNRIQFLTGYWTEPQFFSSCWLEVFLSSLPRMPLHREVHSMVADFIWTTSRRGIEAIQDGNQFFCNLILEVTCHHSYSIR